MTGRPDPATVRAAIELACRAPSVHNTQPWRWLVGAESIHLMADWTRQVSVTDPDGRDLLISCGAALHHLRVALAGLGWSSTVRRLPNPADPAHLASVTVEPAAPSADDVLLSAAITRRRSDRRRSASWPVPRQHIDLLVAHAERTTAGVWVRPVRDGGARLELTRLLAAAAASQEDDRDYLTELAVWSGRSRGAEDGVLVDSALAEPAVHGDTVMRTFARGRLPVENPLSTGDADTGELLVIATAGDGVVHRLRAGEAASAAMLMAAALNLATCPLSQATERSSTGELLAGELLADELLAAKGTAQLVLRVAWVSTSVGHLPRSPRRSVDEVMDHLPGMAPRRDSPWRHRPVRRVPSASGDLW